MFGRILLSSALALSAIPAFATTYTLDPDHTQVHFSWNHFGFSNPGAVFGKLQGTLEYDEADPTRSSVQVTIALDSINSNVPKLDTHLESADFFDAATVSDGDVQEHQGQQQARRRIISKSAAIFPCTARRGR